VEHRANGGRRPGPPPRPRKPFGVQELRGAHEPLARGARLEDAAHHGGLALVDLALQDLKAGLLAARVARDRTRGAYDAAVVAVLAEKDDPVARRRLVRAATTLEIDADDAEAVYRGAEARFRVAQTAVAEQAMENEVPALTP
jgi:hypothetical protein